MADASPGTSRAFPVGVVWGVAVLAGLAVARLPYLTGPLHVLDNDEAVLGIMARRWVTAADGPFLFFAGQNYGLAVFETAPVALAFAAFGVSAEVMTGTILGLFLVALVPWSVALGRLSGSRAWGRALVVVLALLPGWVVWSTKARGLYVAGFVLSGVAASVLSRAPARGRDLALAVPILGALALVQPLWLLVVLPFVGLGVRPLRQLVLAAALTVGTWLAATLSVLDRPAFWEPDFVGPQVGGPAELLLAFTRAFSGRVVPADPGPLATLVGVGGVMTFFGVVTLLALEAVRGRRRALLLSAGAMVLSVAHVFVLQFWVPRYFLPATVLTFVGIATWIGVRGIAFGRVPAVLLAPIVGILVVAIFGLGHPPEGSVLAGTPARDDIRTLIEGLEADGVRGVHAVPTSVQWQILFYGDELIPTRGPTSTDRFPQVVRAVDQARESGQPTALVADIRWLRDELSEIGGFPGYRVGERYLRLDDPEALHLVMLGFELADR